MVIKDKKILVMGDAFLDEYITGKCTRISQEAPVPILEVAPHVRAVLGGAGNTAANISSLGGSPSLVSVIGRDNAGTDFKSLCDGWAIDLDWLSDGRMTTRKVRVLAQNQQLLRMDYEDKKPLGNAYISAILGLLHRHIEKSSVVVLSDYAKGFFSVELLQLIIKECQAHSKPVIIDPKACHKEGYGGCSYITPNQREMLEMMPGFEKPEAAAMAYSRQYRCGVLLTQGEAGISLIRGGEFVGSWPAQAREVFDVSGAGDTVVAAFSLALASGANEEEAIIFANKAAGVVVGKHGTATVTQKEIV